MEKQQERALLIGLNITTNVKKTSGSNILFFIKRGKITAHINITRRDIGGRFFESVQVTNTSKRIK